MEDEVTEKDVVDSLAQDFGCFVLAGLLATERWAALEEESERND